MLTLVDIMKSSRKRKVSDRDTNPIGACEDVSSRYEKVGRVGEGTYGVVYKARDKVSGEYVALKRCIPHHESSDGFPLTTLREIHALRICSRHPNIVRLEQVAVSHHTGVFLVFEYCGPLDLAQIMDEHYPIHRKSPFDQSQVKSLLQQLLSALEFCHSHALIHRDIKPSNMLYLQGKLKLADFGLSRSFQMSKPLTPNVVSLWYRAPELLLWKNHTDYCFGIDLWAVGCVFCEFLQGFPLLDGRDEMDQIQKMTKCLGHPPTDLYGDTAVKAAYSSNKNHGSHYRTSVTDLWDQFGFLSTQGLTLLTKLLEYDPKERWRATQALGSAYFTEEPLPATKMPRFLSSK